MNINKYTYMKKFYLLGMCALIASSSLSARELKFFQGEKEIASGSNFEYSEYTSEEGRPGYEDIVFNPGITLWSDVTVNVTVSAKCTSGQQIQLCAGGSCEAGAEVVKENVRLDADQKLDLKFEYLGEVKEGEVPPTIVTELSAFDPDRSNVKADITVTFSAISGVTSVFVNDSSFRAVAGGIEYSFDAPTQIEIFSLSGETVLKTIADGNGLLSTAYLQPGVYAYKAGSKSGKIYLR